LRLIADYGEIEDQDGKLGDKKGYPGTNGTSKSHFIPKYNWKKEVT